VIQQWLLVNYEGLNYIPGAGRALAADHPRLPVDHELTHRRGVDGEHDGADRPRFVDVVPKPLAGAWADMHHCPGRETLLSPCCLTALVDKGC
jgi:hypothetical protein